MADEEPMPDVDEGMEVEPEIKEDGPMDPMEALNLVLQKSLHHDGLARGLREVVKALDRKVAKLCVLSKSCDEPSYVKLVQSLCKQHKIPIIQVPDSKTLGEWVGLATINEEGEPEKVVGCSSAAILNWGQPSKAKEVLMKHIAQSSS
uniref:40S ribosomal protein S12 n=1 Tax=Lotharella oceanica TaxID=641309 RepID=A0A7S2TSM0_9EUKA|mmetsp:Transcript_25559/g.47659  ORF Transcript_25559/g.47659 Transcript_25559/m.47659 type:complete len:148 (+) Transcript_25559:59-502(+)|eukprot:CAMPEP_0170177796 /NCGR_PEP_ID=MMETSP0040_2-20121228/11064_1 /TAXON_ID=641309 /ORGANISM="Lotharella oceanica, Strain CCMP622" /LENGTH=147 /DNA_ID=CAMNT_0010420587 /DNA_START=39 /DNA_END=482 /DNA_ORIENTATION=+